MRELLRQVRDYIRHPHAWPGGYTKILVMEDGEVVCPACAKANYRLISNSTRHASGDGWDANGVNLYQEGPDLSCSNCNAVITSDYGDPEEAA